MGRGQGQASSGTGASGILYGEAAARGKQPEPLELALAKDQRRALDLFRERFDDELEVWMRTQLDRDYPDDEFPELHTNNETFAAVEGGIQISCGLIQQIDEQFIDLDPPSAEWELSTEQLIAFGWHVNDERLTEMLEAEELC